MDRRGRGAAALVFTLVGDPSRLGSQTAFPRTRQQHQAGLQGWGRRKEGRGEEDDRENGEGEEGKEEDSASASLALPGSPHKNLTAVSSLSAFSWLENSPLA